MSEGGREGEHSHIISGEWRWLCCRLLPPAVLPSGGVARREGAGERSLPGGPTEPFRRLAGCWLMSCCRQQRSGGVRGGGSSVGKEGGREGGKESPQ